MKIARGRDGHDDEFGDVLEVMGWWVQTSGTYMRLRDLPQHVVNRCFWRYFPEGRRWAVRFQPKPYAVREAYALLTFPDLPIEDAAGAVDLEAWQIGKWTRLGAERLLNDWGPTHRGSLYGPPEVVRL